MWIVRLALRRPYTTACLAVLMMLFGAFAAVSMPTDIFPSTNIPIVSVVWSYNGLPARDMEGRMITLSERAFTTGVAQIAGTCQAILRTMPPGTTPPFIIRYSATDVPVMEVGIASKTLGEQELNDIGNQFIRPGLVTAQGANLPP